TLLPLCATIWLVTALTFGLSRRPCAGSVASSAQETAPAACAADGAASGAASAVPRTAIVTSGPHERFIELLLVVLLMRGPPSTAAVLSSLRDACRCSLIGVAAKAKGGAGSRKAVAPGVLPMHAMVLGLLLLRGEGATSATGAGESIAARRVSAVGKPQWGFRARGGGG